MGLPGEEEDAVPYPTRSAWLLLTTLACCSVEDAGDDGTNSAGAVPEGDTIGEQTSIDDSGMVTVTESSENILQHTQRFEFPAPIAPTQRWTQRINGLCGQKCRNGPRHMYSTAFGDRLLVSWMAVNEQDPWLQYGNVATFRVDEQGTFTLLSNVSFEGRCEATYGISANADGSIIAVLCRGAVGAPLLPNAQDLLDTRREDNCTEDWQGRCYPIGNYSELDSPLYIFEYSAGEVTATPERMVLVNHAVGGWRYGHHELMLNEAQDTYFVHLKVTAGPSADNRHEGLTHFAIRRQPDFDYVRVTDGWGCGSGHVLANRMAYNRHHDMWSELCTLDACPHANQFENGRCNSISWYTVPGVTQPQDVTYEGAYLLELDHGENSWQMSGGGAALLSLGQDGWLALAAGPGYAAVETKPDTIGLMRLPTGIADLASLAVTTDVPLHEGGELQGQQSIERYQWNWLQLPEPDPALEREKRAGLAAMAYFAPDGEDSERLLVGWSPTIEFQGLAREYVVSELDRDGQLRGQPLRLTAAGWGEDNRWQTMPNSGCVVFPFAWVGEAPGNDYPFEADGREATEYPTSMHLTSLCPGGATQPPLTSTMPLPDSERWGLSP